MANATGNEMTEIIFFSSIKIIVNFDIINNSSFAETFLSLVKLGNVLITD